MIYTAIYFVSSNINKFNEVQKILEEYQISIEFYQAELPELQSNSLETIALFSAKHAFSLIREPLFVEDTGLFIQSLNGFPGPYSAFVFKTIGNEGILKLMHETSNRSAVFRTVIALQITENRTFTFLGETHGTIALSERGKQGWGYDPIFVPAENNNETYAEMGYFKKNAISHRKKSIEKLAQWIRSNSRLHNP